MENLSNIAIDYMINAPCNLSCPFCYGPPPNLKNELSLIQKLKLAENLVSQGVKFIVIAGGEPFICDDLENFCKASYQYGLKIGIQTNGFYTEKLNSVFPLIDWIAFPLDGISIESQIKMRTSSKHYAKFIDSISSAIEYKKTNNNPSFKIKIGTVVSKYNINELESMALFLSETNIDVWKLYRIRKRGKGKVFFEDYHVDDEIVLEKIKYIKAKFTSLNIYYSSDNLSDDSYIIIDPDSTTYVINQTSQKIFGKLISETGIFNEDLWKMIIEYANLKMITNNIRQSFPGWMNYKL